MREYDPHRRATPPRFWSWALLAMAISFAITYALPWDDVWWLSVIGGFVGAGCGFTVLVVRWMVYRHRHPLRPCGPHCLLYSDFIRAQREVARWQ